MLAGVALVYVLLSAACQSPQLRVFPSARLLLTNLWLVISSVAVIKKLGLNFEITRAGRRDQVGGALSALMVALIIAMTLWWPDRSSQTTYATHFQRLIIIGLVPLGEELFFRGVLLDKIKSATGSGIAGVFLVSVLFGACHLPQGVTVATAMAILSAVLSVVTLATSSLLWPVLIHMCWNALAVLKDIPPGSDRFIVAGVTSAAAIGIALRGVHTRLRASARE